MKSVCQLTNIEARAALRKGTQVDAFRESGRCGKMHMTDIVTLLKSHEAVHSIIFFGSSVRGEAASDSDIDICIIETPGCTLTLTDKLRITRELPEIVDVSFFHDLPLDIRQRVLREGEILYTIDDYYIYTLVRETDFEMPKYRKMLEEYYEETIRRVEGKLASRR